MTAAIEPLPPTEATEKDVRKMVRLWRTLLDASGGPFLLGDWSIADAYFTPIATRFRTYGVDLAQYGDAGPAAEYCDLLLQQPEFLEWERLALAES